MKLAWTLVIAWAASGAVIGQDAFEGIPAEQPADPFGPFKSVQVDTLSLLFYQAPPDKADTLGAGNWDLSVDVLYSEHEVSDWSTTNQLNVFRDHELMRLEFRAEVGLTDKLDLEILLPFRYLTFGVLEEFIEEFHRLTGFGTEGTRASFRDEAVLPGPTTVYRGRENLFTISDLPISLKYAFLEDRVDAFGLAVRAAIELPTGSSSAVTGNGGIDGGFGVLLQKSVSDWTFYASADGQFQQTPDVYKAVGLEVEPAIASLAFATEWRIARSFALVAQFQYTQNLIEGLDVASMSRDRAVLGVGFHWAVTDTLIWRFNFLEDLISGPSYDVLFHTGLTIRFR